MSRKRKPQRQKGRKWRYAEHAKMKRNCEQCLMPLEQDEAHICHMCYVDMCKEVRQ